MEELPICLGMPVYLSQKKPPHCCTRGCSLVQHMDMTCFFGATGSSNDINILAHSPLFNDVVHGVAPHIEYIVNRNQYQLGYYLADGIYPRLATLMKTIYSPQEAFCTNMQEGYMKDVERAFGILHTRCSIVWGPARMWCKDNLHSIMMTHIILHNMIVEDEYEYVEAKSDDEDMCP